MKKAIGIFLAVLSFVLVFASCDNFFSNSWGNPRVFDPAKIAVEPGNVNKLVEKSLQNPALAGEVTKKFIEELKKNPDPAYRADLSNGGITLATKASGVFESVITHAGSSMSDLLEGGDDADNEKLLKDLFSNIQSDFKASNGAQSAANITEIIKLNLTAGSYSDGQAPAFGSYGDTVDPENVAKSVVVLTMGLIGDKTFDDDWSDMEKLADGLKLNEDKSRVIVKDGGTPGDTSIVMAACLNLIVSNDRFKDNAITGAIRDAFFENK